jgi:uncharacterized protein
MHEGTSFKFAEWSRLPLLSRRASEIGGAIGSAVFAAFVIGVAVTISIVKNWPLFPRSYLAVLLLWSAIGYAGGYIKWAHTAWRLDNALRIRRGRWWRTETILPRVRVQHLDLSRGPVERRFGLATLTVYTAGSSLSSVSLSGLDDATAIQLRDALLPTVTEDERDGI